MRVYDLTKVKRDMAIMFILGVVVGGLFTQYLHESYSCNLILNGVEERYGWKNETELNAIIDEVGTEYSPSFWDRISASAPT